ncbi:MAG: endonuclease III [Chloroflexi bacterium]|nr:endonuclease III [Chloroflexota bacterium]
MMLNVDTHLAQKYNVIHQTLLDAYDEPAWRQHLPPVDELVSTILSQSTSDINRDKGFYALKERYPDWESVMNAPEAEVVATIRSAGLANQKGPRIQNALRYVKGSQGAISLDFLDELSLDEAKAWLTAIKGIGPKTAAIILLFAFNRPAFPVDTHVHRITRRLGLIGPKITADKAHPILENMGDPATFYPLHLNLIRHGREICLARKPKCEICPLQAYCDYYQGS